jgi:drug/metabolite transporter (DMT)-like permease
MVNPPARSQGDRAQGGTPELTSGVPEAPSVTAASSEIRGSLLVLLSTAAYGSMPIMTKLAYAEGSSPTGLLAARFLIALAVMTALAPRAPSPPWRQRLVLWGLGAVFVGNAAAYFQALTTVPAALVSLLLYTYPVIVTLLAALLGLETLRVRSLLAALLVVAGGALTVGLGALAEVPRGAWLALVSALVYASYIVLGSRFAASVPTEIAARHVVQVCAVAFAGWGAATGQLAWPRTFTLWALLVGIGVFSTVVAMRAFLAGLAHVGPGRAAVLSSLEIVVTLVLATLFLGEVVTARQWCGGALILAGVAAQNAGLLKSRFT